MEATSVGIFAMDTSGLAPAIVQQTFVRFVEAGLFPGVCCLFSIIAQL